MPFKLPQILTIIILSVALIISLTFNVKQALKKPETIIDTTYITSVVNRVDTVYRYKYLKANLAVPEAKKDTAGNNTYHSNVSTEYGVVSLDTKVRGELIANQIVFDFKIPEIHFQEIIERDRIIEYSKPRLYATFGINTDWKGNTAPEIGLMVTRKKLALAYSFDTNNRHSIRLGFNIFKK